MLLYLERHGPALVAHIEGEIDLAVAEKFRGFLEQALDEEETANTLLLNLQDVTFIDSSGLGVILGRYKRMAQKGGKIFISDMQPQVERILELSGVLRIIRSFASEAEALRALGVTA